MGKLRRSKSKYLIDILDLSETGWTECDKMICQKYNFVEYNLGDDEHKHKSWTIAEGEVKQTSTEHNSDVEPCRV